MLHRLTSTPVLICFSLVVFSVIAIAIPSTGPSNQINVLFGAASFVFGIVIAFFISMSSSRLNDIGQTLNQDDANYASIYKLSKTFGKDTQDETRQLLDRYLQDQIDHYLADFEQTRPTFDNLTNFLIGLKVNSNQGNTVYGQILDYIQELQNDRVRVIALVKSKLQMYEWLTILILAAIILFCIFSLNNHTPVSIVISILLSTSTVMLILILRDLVLLKWKEQTWIWSCLDETFLELDLSPYYPAAGVREGRIALKRGEKTRLVSYKSPYPNFTDKEVTEILP